MLWNELTKSEWELFLAMPESLNNEMIYGTLRSINFQGKRKTRQKLLTGPAEIESDYIPTHDRYRGYQRLDVEIQAGTTSLPKVPKFSGYVKSSSAVGSKHQQTKSSYLDLMTINSEDYNEIEFDWFSYLTVDESIAFFPRRNLKNILNERPLERPKRFTHLFNFPISSYEENLRHHLRR